MPPAPPLPFTQLARGDLLTCSWTRPDLPRVHCHLHGGSPRPCERTECGSRRRTSSALSSTDPRGIDTTTPCHATSLPPEQPKRLRRDPGPSPGARFLVVLAGASSSRYEKQVFANELLGRMTGSISNGIPTVISRQRWRDAPPVVHGGRPPAAGLLPVSLGYLWTHPA